MSEVTIEYRTSNREAPKLGGLSQMLDDAIGNTPGYTLFRGVSGWGPSPTKFEVFPLVGVSSTSGGGLGAWQPSAGPLAIVLRCIVAIKIPSTGAANITVGVGSSATTSYTNLITATSIASAGMIDSITNQITATAAVALNMPLGNYVTFTGSATTVGFVGAALIEYWVP